VLAAQSRAACNLLVERRRSHPTLGGQSLLWGEADGESKSHASLMIPPRNLHLAKIKLAAQHARE
jgi:hypothetical protein